MEILQRNDGRQSISSDYLVTRRSLPFRLLWTSGSVVQRMSFSLLTSLALAKNFLARNGCPVTESDSEKSFRETKWKSASRILALELWSAF